MISITTLLLLLSIGCAQTDIKQTGLFFDSNGQLQFNDHANEAPCTISNLRTERFLLEDIDTALSGIFDVENGYDSNKRTKRANKQKLLNRIRRLDTGEFCLDKKGTPLIVDDIDPERMYVACNSKTGTDKTSGFFFTVQDRRVVTEQEQAIQRQLHLIKNKHDEIKQLRKHCLYKKQSVHRKKRHR